MTLAQIRQYVLDFIKTNGLGGVNANHVQTALLALIDRVVAQTFLSGWLIPGTTNTIVANGDDAYRLGKSIFGRSTDDASGATVQVEGAIVATKNMYCRPKAANTLSMTSVALNTAFSIMVEGTTGGGPAFIEFHRPSVSLTILGVDTDNKLKFRGFDNVARPVILEGQQDNILFNSQVQSNFITLAASPTTAQLTAGKVGVYGNSSNGQIRMWVNNSGTMQSILFS